MLASCQVKNIRLEAQKSFDLAQKVNQQGFTEVPHLRQAKAMNA